MSMIDHTLSAIESTRNRGSRDLLLGYFSPSPHHFPPCVVLIPATSPLHFAPICTLHTPKDCQPPPTVSHRSPHNATSPCYPPTYITFSLFPCFPLIFLQPSHSPFSLSFYGCVCFWQLQFVYMDCSCLLLLVVCDFAGGWKIFGVDYAPLGLKATHHLFDRSPN
jgi:hypothetical protein